MMIETFSWLIPGKLYFVKQDITCYKKPGSPETGIHGTNEYHKLPAGSTVMFVRLENISYALAHHAENSNFSHELFKFSFLGPDSKVFILYLGTDHPHTMINTVLKRLFFGH